MYDNSTNVESGKREVYYRNYTIVKFSYNEAVIALKVDCDKKNMYTPNSKVTTKIRK